MTEEQKQIEKLKSEGYDDVGVYNAKPNEEDFDHSHDFDTYIQIQTGEMLVRINGEENLLRAKDEFFVPKDVVHYAKVGVYGARYIHGERH